MEGTGNGNRDAFFCPHNETSATYLISQRKLRVVAHELELPQRSSSAL